MANACASSVWCAPRYCILAPLLFLLYINDLCACVNNMAKLCRWCFNMLYIYSELDCTALQDDLNKLGDGTYAWLMELMWINVNTQESLTNYLLSFMVTFRELCYFQGSTCIQNTLESPSTRSYNYHEMNTHEESPAKLIKLIVFFAFQPPPVSC